MLAKLIVGVAVVVSFQAGADEAATKVTGDELRTRYDAVVLAVGATEARAYAGPVGEGRALLVIDAPFAPMGTALNAIRTVNRFPSIDVGLAEEDVYIRDEPQVDLSGRVLQGTVFYMSNPHRSLPQGHILGSNPIIHSRPRTSAIRGGAYISTKFWPMRLVSKPKVGTSAMRGTWLFSSLFGLPTIIRNWPPRDDIPTTI